MEKIIETILNYVEPDEEITAESSLKNDCGLTSFDMVCLIDELSAQFGVEVADTEVRKCSTVGELYALYTQGKEAKV